jgi:3-oxoadipate enol-lactonase
MKERISGIGINHEITGSGPAIVLSHSLASNLTMWDPQVDALSQSFTVVRFDTRGHGMSDAPDGPYSMTDLAEDAAGLLDHLGIARAHWVGLSLGGAIAQTHALAHPELVLSLTIADATSAYPIATHGMWQERIDHVRKDGMAGVADGTLGRWFTPAFREANPELVADIRTMIMGTPTAGFIGAVQAIMGFDVSARLGEITCPTLVICGAEDQALPTAHSMRIHEGISGSRLSLIPHAAHIANIEQPDAFLAAMLDFLPPTKGRAAG